MKSINQNINTSGLPNFRNLGILLRILVIVDGVCLAAALLTAEEPSTLMRKLLDLSAVVQPVLLASLLVLAALNNWLRHLGYWVSITAVAVLELIVITAVYLAERGIFSNPIELVRDWLFTLLITGVLIGYFDLRGRALSPALTEARLQALQARIRPHFLFNSITAVLSLIRKSPERAEDALQDMADLFRVLMADNRELTPIAHEVELCRQYLALEQLRLGDRLQIVWDLSEMPADALTPPLVLQPLLENAVYHGIEPNSGVGTITFRVFHDRDRLFITLRNPYHRDGIHHAGNRMALANIRERLALHFDAEASLKTEVKADAYEVRITIPYLKSAA